MRGRSAGTTLLELVIAMTLGLLIATAALQAFMASGKLMAWVSVRADLDANALLALNRLAREIRQSSFTSLTIVSNPAALSFEINTDDPTIPISTTFQPDAEFIVYYYDQAAQELVRESWSSTSVPPLTPLPAFNTASRLPAQQLSGLLGISNNTAHTMATGVVAMSVAPFTFPVAVAVDGIDVALTIRKTVPGGRTVETQIQSAAYPMN